MLLNNVHDARLSGMLLLNDRVNMMVAKGCMATRRCGVSRLHGTSSSHVQLCRK